MLADEFRFEFSTSVLPNAARGTFVSIGTKIIEQSTGSQSGTDPALPPEPKLKPVTEELDTQVWDIVASRSDDRKLGCHSSAPKSSKK